MNEAMIVPGDRGSSSDVPKPAIIESIGEAANSSMFSPIDR